MTTTAATDLDLGQLGLPEVLPGFTLSLRQQNRSPHTVLGYRTAVQQLDAFLTAQGMPRALTAIKREHVETFILSVLEGKSSSTAATRFRALKVFFGWLLEEGEITESPMARMKIPKIEEHVPEVLSTAQVEKLLKSCAGNGFRERRDAAIISLLFDSGLRRQELANLTTGDVDIENEVVTVMGKGKRERRVPFGVNAGRALDRYLRIRKTHPRARRTDGLWVGRKGPITDGDSIYALIKRRAEEAGIGAIHPHQLRHSAAHYFRLNGGEDTDLMKVMGWKTRIMLERYGASLATERAIASHRKHSPLDNLGA